MPLMWGEVIPWHFVQEASTQLNIPLPQVIYIGQPPTKKTDELKTLGRDITNFGKQHLSHKKIVVLISGDLSHYHSKNPT
jgi:aromatic ring-opening dioxygenase LigB subunit